MSLDLLPPLPHLCIITFVMSSGLHSRADSIESLRQDLEKGDDDHQAWPLLSRSASSPSSPQSAVRRASSCLSSGIMRLSLLSRLAILGAMMLMVSFFGSYFGLFGESRLPLYTGLRSPTYSSIANSTLGFQNIFVISLPDRYKKRDILAIMAHSQGLSFTFQDGVSLNAAMSDQDKKESYPINSTLIQVNKLASFRSHANMWQKMLVDDISTALILEDDADWDVQLRSQLQNVQTHLSGLMQQMSPKDATIEQRRHKQGEWPSTGWDILRLGICLEKSYTNGQFHGLQVDQVPSRTYLDDNVPDEGSCIGEQEIFMRDFGHPLNNPEAAASSSSPRAGGDHSGMRILVPSLAPVCLHAYAITKEGAAKMLFYQNKVRLGLANDLGIAAATESGFLKSYSVLPTLFSQFKSNGDTKNSDIETGSSSETPGVETLFQGGHFCVVNSTRASLATSRYPNAW